MISIETGFIDFVVVFCYNVDGDDIVKCPNCTAELEFDAKSQHVSCDYCGSSFDPKELRVSVKKAAEKEANETYEGKSYACSQCGATLLTFDETAITFCSYCGSQAMIESKMVKRNNPQFIIPFKKTKEECIAAYRKKVNQALFAPNYMKDDIVVSKFRGIYIPYCIYKMSFHGVSTNKGSKYSHRRGDYEYYDDYKIDAVVDADYDGISYDMVSNLYDKFSHSIPHSFKEAEPFNANYLAGFYADTADVGDCIYEDEALNVIDGDSTNRMRRKREFIRYGCARPTVRFNVSEKRMGMFPLYFLAIRDKANKYVNYAVVNGQTGKVTVDLPVDFKKYIFASLVLTIPIFLLINSSLVIVPKVICVLSIITAFISMIISVVQMKKIHVRENHLDDEGYVYNNTNSKKREKIKFKYICKQLLSIILGLFVLFMNFVSDAYYYGTSIIILCLVIWSFYDLIKEHNLLVSTKLPQLEKRGGSENE